MTVSFERGIVILSIDTEQIWGYRDTFSESQFEARFPDATRAHLQLLAHLSAAKVPATWFVVGGLALEDSAGSSDARISDLLVGESIQIPGNTEAGARLWYNPTFLEHLRESCPAQEIGLHGGLTHLVWTDARTTRDLAHRELTEGIKALDGLCSRLCSFSFPRDGQAYHDLLPQNGLRCFRGCPPALAWRLGTTIPGVILRVLDEVRRGTPPIVWPHEAMPGLWNIPASMFLYPIGPARARLIGLRSRVERFRRGLEAATRHRAIFHFCLHPENLAESTHGISLLDEILDNLTRARDRGDVEIMTMSDMVTRMEGEPSYDWYKKQQHSDLFATNRRS
jgi:hypothetical protein